MTIGRRAALAVLAGACVVPLIWPGDIPFINDEPKLIINAVRANAARHLAHTGLLGTFGFTYGPFPTWVYQALTGISHDLVVVAALHAALMSGTTAGAVWWLSRSLRLWPWFAAVPLLSPYFWFDARVLWDNPQLIPLGALAMAGYAANLTSESAWGLRLALAAMIAMLLVHLMSISLVLPIVLHIASRWRVVLRHRVSVAAIALAGAAIGWPYWTTLAGHRETVSMAGLNIHGLMLPLSGGRLLSARQLDYFFGPGPTDGMVMRLAAAVSTIAYPLVWGGIVIAVSRTIGAIRSGQWTARSHVSAVIAGALVCQAAIHALTGKFEHPQYYNGTWIAFTILPWFAVDAVAESRRGFRWIAAASTGLLAVALLVAVATIGVRLHRTGGTREVYGPTIANQQRVARALAHYAPDSRVVVHVDLYERYPHTLAILRELNPTDSAIRSQEYVEVRYASDDPASGVIMVVGR